MKLKERIKQMSPYFLDVWQYIAIILIFYNCSSYYFIIFIRHIKYVNTNKTLTINYQEYEHYNQLPLPIRSWLKSIQSCWKAYAPYSDFKGERLPHCRVVCLLLVVIRRILRNWAVIVCRKNSFVLCRC